MNEGERKRNDERARLSERRRLRARIAARGGAGARRALGRRRLARRSRSPGARSGIRGLACALTHLGDDLAEVESSAEMLARLCEPWHALQPSPPLANPAGGASTQRRSSDCWTRRIGVLPPITCGLRWTTHSGTNWRSVRTGGIRSETDRRHRRSGVGGDRRRAAHTPDRCGDPQFVETVRHRAACRGMTVDERDCIAAAIAARKRADDACHLLDQLGESRAATMPPRPTWTTRCAGDGAGSCIRPHYACGGFRRGRDGCERTRRGARCSGKGQPHTGFPARGDRRVRKERIRQSRPKSPAPHRVAGWGRLLSPPACAVACPGRRRLSAAARHSG